MKKLPGCLPARLVTIELRLKTGGFPERHRVAIPEDVSKSQFLKYVRGVHVDETAKIIKWPEAVIWIANPRAFSNFKLGHLKSDTLPR